MTETLANMQTETEDFSQSPVKLISWTQTASGEKNLEEIVAYCARVSNPTNQELNQNNSKLIDYLIRNSHWSPFEMVTICLEINTTRDIARQILRHRSFSFQEFSQRYAKSSCNFVVRETRLQDHKNRQNSLETNDEELNVKWIEIQNRIGNECRNAYEWAITNGIAKEQARVILPEGNTPTKMYMSGTLRSWMHYIQIRSEKGTQKEHRVVAIECANAIKPIFPLIEKFLSE